MKKSQRLIIEAGFGLAVIAANTLHSILILHQQARGIFTRTHDALRNRIRG